MARILIVEDDTAILNQYAFFLNRQGYEVLTADNARSGLQQATSGQPDLIILDMLMPGVSGIDFLTQLKQTGATPKVIVLSNTESPKVKQQAQELGALRYLLKVEYTPHALGDVVKEVLG